MQLFILLNGMLTTVVKDDVPVIKCDGHDMIKPSPMLRVDTRGNFVTWWYPSGNFTRAAKFEMVPDEQGILKRRFVDVDSGDIWKYRG